MMLVRGLVSCAWLIASPEAPAAAPALPEASATPTETPRVLVVGSPADDAAVRRVAAELEAIGLDVQIEITLDPQPLESPDLDEDAAGWRAIVWVDAAEGEAHLLVRDGSGRTTARIAEHGPDQRPASDAVLAHRTVEMLRAGLRQGSSAEPPAPTQAPAPEPAPSPSPTPTPTPATTRYDTLFVVLGGAIAWSPGGLAPTGHAAFALRWQAHPRVGIALRGLAPLHGREVRQPQGRATVVFGTAEPWLWVGLGRPSWRWQPDLGVGAGAVFLSSRGNAVPPLVSRSSVVVAAMIAGGAGVSVWLHPRARLRLDGFFGAAAPRPAVRFAGREVAHWGRPYTGGTLGVEVGVL